jgi:HAD superfamily hydrolase (TIGR01509 family)
MDRVGVLVDVDGTLVDSNYHHALAWSRALHDHGHDAHLAAIHRLVGMGATELLASLSIRDADVVHAVQQSWRTHFDALLPEIRAIDGAAALLRTLHDHGLVVVLATSSPEDLLDALMAQVGADDAVDVVITASDVDAAKPDPELFAVALDRAGLDPTRALALGDSVWDVEAAGRAGLETIGVETGGFSRFELEHAGAIAVYRDAQHLVGQFASSPLGRMRGRSRRGR